MPHYTRVSVPSLSIPANKINIFKNNELTILPLERLVLRRGGKGFKMKRTYFQNGMGENKVFMSLLTGLIYPYFHSFPEGIHQWAPSEFSHKEKFYGVMD